MDAAARRAWMGWASEKADEAEELGQSERRSKQFYLAWKKR